jgi:hypothetical protein
MKANPATNHSAGRKSRSTAAEGARSRGIIADEYSGAALSAVRYHPAARRGRYPTGSMC